MLYRFIIMGRPRTRQIGLSVSGYKKGKGKVRHAKWPPPDNMPKPGVHVYVQESTKEWQEHVAWTAKAAGVRPIQGPVKMILEIRLHAKPMTNEGDCDNFSKTVQDALNHIAYEDDAQILDLRVIKRFVRSKKAECAIVEIGPMALEEVIELEEMMKEWTAENIEYG